MYLTFLPIFIVLSTLSIQDKINFKRHGIIDLDFPWKFMPIFVTSACDDKLKNVNLKDEDHSDE